MSTQVTCRFEDNGIAWIHLCDEANKNVFSHTFVESFIQVLDQVEAREPKVCIVHGLSDVFAAGADKDSLIELSQGKFVVRDLVISERLINTRFPIISAMEGHAMGGGLVMGLCSDMVVMAAESRYGAVFMNMGFTPGMGTTTLLSALVGPFIANEMMFTGRRFKGKELAEKSCAANAIVPKAQVLAKARDMALQIIEKPKTSIYLLKNALSTPKKKLLVDARLQEDMMHHISFALPETRANIQELYAQR